MTAGEILIAAAEWLERHEWTQGVMARDHRGGPCPSDAPEASAWCVAGAIRRVSPHDAATRSAVEWLGRRVAPDGLVSTWNDQPARTKAEVVRALREAAHV